MGANPTQRRYYLEKDFWTEVAMGNVDSWEKLHKFGRNPDVGTAEETIWPQGGRYVYLAAASILKISSSDVADDVAGTGALTVQVYGLDENYVEINETVILTGQTEVNTELEYLRIFRMIVRTAGATGWNEGVLYAGTGTVTDGVPANVYALILIGKCQTEMAIWTVPAGKRIAIHKIYGSVQSGKTLEIEMRVRPLGEVFQRKYSADVTAGKTDDNFKPPLICEAKTDIEIIGEIYALPAVDTHAGFVAGVRTD